MTQSSSSTRESNVIRHLPALMPLVEDSRASSYEAEVSRAQQLYRIGRILARAKSVEDTLEEVARAVQETLHLQRAVFLFDGRDGTRCITWNHTGVLVRGAGEADSAAFEDLDYLAGRLRRIGQAPSFRGSAVRKLVLPLVVGRSPIFGVFELERGEAFDEPDLGFASAVANDVAIALERQAMTEALVAKQKDAERARLAAEMQRAEAQAARWSAEWLVSRFERLVDGLDRAFVWVASADTLSLTYLSGSVETVLGYRRGDLLGGDRYLRTIHPDDRDDVERKLRSAACLLQSRRFLHRSIDADGTIHWFHTGVHVDAHQPHGVMIHGLTVDVTELQCERERIESELELSQTLTSSMAEGIVAVDRNGTITFMNPAARQSLEMGRAEPVGRAATEVFQIKAADGSWFKGNNPITRVLVEGSAIESDDAVFVRSNGETFPVAYAASPIAGPYGAAGCVIAFRNVLEVQRAERLNRFLAQLSGVLGSSLEYRSTLAAIAQLSVPYFADVCFIDEIGPEGETTRAEVVFADERKLPLVDTVRDALHPAGTRNPQARVLASGEPILLADVSKQPTSTFDEAHTTLIRAIGAQSMIVVPLYAGGSTLGALTFVIAESGRRYTPADVPIAETIAHRASGAIQNAQLYHRMHEAVRERQEILAVVSHDLRTPLQSILMSVRLLAQQTPGACQYLKIIERSGERMNRLLSDLLDTSSVEAGRLSIELESASLLGLLDEAKQTGALLASQKGVEFSCSMPEKDTEVMCDRQRIFQVLGNLLGNAMKFTPAKGKVELRARRERGEIRFEVTDTGCGMTEDQIPRAFERHWQARETAAAGRGLGLYIASGIVATHGGQIGARSRPGHGSTFYFTIPLKGVGEGDVRPAAPSLAKTSPAKSVLVVEHDPKMRGALEAMLESKGFHVISSPGGPDAFEKLRSGRVPDVILLDLAAHVMDGWTFLSEQQRDPVFRSVPVIVTSSDETVRRRAKASRAMFIAKPIRPDELLEKITATATGLDVRDVRDVS